MFMKKYFFVMVALGAVIGLGMTLSVSAATVNQPVHEVGGMHRGAPGSGARPAVVGTVTSISGTTLTVTRTQGFPSRGVANTPVPQANPTVFSVDASTAQVIKDGATSTVASIATGDRVMVQGTLQGTSIVATVIRDGQMPGRGVGIYGMHGTSTPIVGTGEPVVAGSVVSMNGSSVVVGTTTGIRYTIDTSNAKVVMGNAVSTLSNVQVGDRVVVQGVVQGTAVTASTLVDQTSHASGGAPQNNFGFFAPFRQIGQFFSHLFGF